MTTLKIGDKVTVDAQALVSRYEYTPNLIALIRSHDYNFNATITSTRRNAYDLKLVDYIVAFDVDPSIENCFFHEDELELVSPAEVVELDKAIAEAERFTEFLRQYRKTVLGQ